MGVGEKGVTVILEVRQKESERKRRCIEITLETDSHREKLPGQLAVKQEKVSSKGGERGLVRAHTLLPSLYPIFSITTVSILGLLNSNRL